MKWMATARLVAFWVIASILTALFLVAEPVSSASQLTIANCFRPGIVNTPLNNSRYNDLLRSTVGNNSISVTTSYSNHHPNGIVVELDGEQVRIYDFLYIDSVTVNGQSVQVEQITHTQNTYMNDSCTGFTWFDDNRTSSIYKLRNADGSESGYALKRDCGNLVRYTPTASSWESNGETEILSSSGLWSKNHQRIMGGDSVGPKEVRRGETVRWRHRVNIVNRVGGSAIPLTLNTISEKGTNTATLSGANANISNLAVNITTSMQNSGWQETTWIVPSDASDGDLYCQYLEWNPDRSGSTSRASSENNREQCIEVTVGVNDWSLEGTTQLNGGNVDLLNQPADTCAVWTHTLRKVGAATFTGTITFSQNSTEGDLYGTGFNNTACSGSAQNRQSGSANLTDANTANPLTLIDSLNRPNMYRFAIKVPAGKRYCQNLAWTVPTDSNKNGQTGRLCASALSSGATNTYTSKLRACAVKIRSIAGNTVRNCVDGTTSGAVAATIYAKTQDKIYFRYEIDKAAQYQSRQSSNYIPLAAFDSNMTICTTNGGEAKDCVARGTVNGVLPTYRPPTTAGQTSNITLNPAYMSPAMEPWNRAADNCTLTPASKTSPVAFSSGIAPSSCTDSESDLARGSNAAARNESRNDFVHQGAGRIVKNTDLGVRKADLTQTISLSAVKIVVHKNDDTHTYTYDYASKHTGSCSSTTSCTSTKTCCGNCSCGSSKTCCSPCACADGGSSTLCCESACSCGSRNSCCTGTCACNDGCQTISRTWWGTRATGNTMSGSCCSCSGPSNGSTYTRDAVESYDSNEHTWIEVAPDGPIKAELSFAIPYNYTITPQFMIYPATSERIQLGGSEFGYSASLQVNPRYNSEVGETYATATRPDTKWAVTEFYVGPNRASNPNPTSNYERTGASTNPCTFYTYDTNGSNGLANTPWGCNSTVGTGSLNTSSETNLYNLQNGSSLNLGLTTTTIADAPIGTKFCVSVAVMDKDSTYQNGYGSTSQGVWTVYKPECVVIGKRPMVNVLGDGLYSDGDIEGSNFEKKPHGQSNTGAFGSYGEYEVVSNGVVRNFASGATLGTGAGGVPLGSTATATMLPRGVLNGSCWIAPLTFRNSNCSTTNLSTSLGQMSGANDSHGLARNIRHRYTDRTDATIVSGSVTPSSTACTVTTTSNGSTQCISYVKANGALTINASAIPAGRTVVIEATGAVLVNGNITLSNGSYTNIAQIPQVLIFAPSINIAPGVTRIDAWLLAGLNGGSGTINTCNGVTSVSQLDGSKCTNQLKVNAPVMASRVLLHRTAGADTGMPGSAQPAEVFYLSPATYLWAYTQSSNLSQAYLTYAREAAPRF